MGVMKHITLVGVDNYTAGSRTFSASAAGAGNHIKIPTNMRTCMVNVINDTTTAPILQCFLGSTNTMSAARAGIIRLKAGEVFVDAFRTTASQGITIRASASVCPARWYVTFE